MSVTSDRHARVSELFTAACDLERSVQREFLARECGADSGLLREVEALLELDESDDDAPSRVDGLFAYRTAHPEVVGDYRVLSVIGEGGMGVVYRARQQSPERTVALKVIRPGLASREVLGRFLREVEVLGALDHPGIARIHEAGTSTDDSGTRPYFAMELVDGLTVTAYARERDLGTRDRMLLMSKICDAVHHAHEAGIVHRDLKPANILVTPDGQPKVLDFGVAHAHDDHVDAATRMTVAGQVVGTVPYMSPEQLAGETEVDGRTDVYALGVLAYELLSGQLPLPVRNVPLVEAVQTVRDREPTRLGSRHACFRGDVETIVAKALEKDPARRYASAAELGRDIDRYLRDIPIEARRPSPWELALKFARRNRLVVAATSVILVSSLTATSVSVASASRARLAANAATLEADKANAVRDFLTMMLDAADPFAASGHSGPDVTVGDMLDRAAIWVDTAFPDQPDVELTARLAIANSFKGLARHDEARAQLEAALAAVAGHDAPQAAADDSLIELKIRRRLAVLDSLDGEHEQARRELTQVLAEQERRLGATDGETLSTSANLALVLRRQGRLDEAARLGRQTLARCREGLAENDETRAAAAVNLAGVLRQLDPESSGDEVLELYGEALSAYEAIYADDHPRVAMLLNNRARLHLSRGDLESAAEGFGDASRRLERSLRRAHPYTGTVLNNLAFTLHELGELEAADRAYVRAVAAYSASVGPTHEETLGTRYSHAFVQYDLGRFGAAEATWRAVAAGLRASGDGDHPRAHLAIAYAAESVAALGRHAAAAEEVLAVHSRLVASEGASGDTTRAVARALARIYAGWNRPDDAERFRLAGQS